MLKYSQAGAEICSQQAADQLLQVMVETQQLCPSPLIVSFLFPKLFFQSQFCRFGIESVPFFVVLPVFPCRFGTDWLQRSVRTDPVSKPQRLSGSYSRRMDGLMDPVQTETTSTGSLAPSTASRNVSGF